MAQTHEHLHSLFKESFVLAPLLGEEKYLFGCVLLQLTRCPADPSDESHNYVVVEADDGSKEKMSIVELKRRLIQGNAALQAIMIKDWPVSVSQSVE